jgi:hypothetical protein
MLVPLSTVDAVSDVIPTDSTSTPGAKISMEAPKLEKEALASVLLSMAPTVMALGRRRGR